jgi:hypothetical protein
MKVLIVAIVVAIPVVVGINRVVRSLSPHAQRR